MKAREHLTKLAKLNLSKIYPSSGLDFQPLYEESTLNGLTESIVDWIHFNDGVVTKIFCNGFITGQRVAFTDDYGLSWIKGYGHKTEPSKEDDISKLHCYIDGKQVIVEIHKNYNPANGGSESDQSKNSFVTVGSFAEFYAWYIGHFSSIKGHKGTSATL